MKCGVAAELLTLDMHLAIKITDSRINMTPEILSTIRCNSKNFH